MTPVQFHRTLLTWYDRYGRKDLPWQQDITPYRVWVSEIMLQQTQVQTVIPFFERFVERFPSVAALATATEDEVMHLWTGLGYYSRARNLHRSAAIVRDQYGGDLPDDIDALITLPGIGRSTAGAIIAIAHEQPAPILDGNVKRVLARLHAVEGWPGQSLVAKELWALAEAYVPEQRTRDYTQAMMDLGATLCTRSRPDCHRCPMQAQCRAHQGGDLTRYPGKKSKKPLPVKHTRMLIVENEHGEVLLHKRPPTGIWSGLWIFPQVTLDTDPAEFCQLELGIDIVRISSWPPLRHTFSHYHLDIEPIHIVTASNNSIAENDQALWYAPQAPKAVGLAAPVVKLLSQLSAAETVASP